MIWQGYAGESVALHGQYVQPTGRLNGIVAKVPLATFA